MADKKISDLNELVVASISDVIAIVDESGAFETKYIKVSNLFASPGPIGGINPDSGEFTTLELTTGPQVDEISTNINLGINDNILPTQNAVKQYVDNTVAEASAAMINPIHVSGDSTAVAGDLMLVDTTNGNVNIEMIRTPKGKIIVKKISSDANIVIITPNSGTIDGDPSYSLSTLNESVTFVTDIINFYIV